MARAEELPDALRENMEANNIDVELSLSILASFNRGEFDHFEPTRATDLPTIDGETVVDFTSSPGLAVGEEEARARLSELLPDLAVRSIGTAIGRAERGRLSFSNHDLNRLGLLLLPRVAYGVLNGGSATSYADTKKNSAFHGPLFELLRDEFDTLGEISRGRAKGLTPAFVQPDGTPGPTFLQLKMRALLIQAMQSRAAMRKLAGDSQLAMPDPLLPLFQMTSVHTDEELGTAYGEYRNDAMLLDLIAETGLDPTDATGAVQPLISAYTHGDEGRPKRVFSNAYGRDNETIPLPGGHGQNFAVLADTYRSLYESGKRFAYLGNVDNLGFLPDPVGIAYLALTGRPAGFDFALKTPIDVKGGILVRDQRGRINCADIGPAISRDEVEREEAAGTPILFNAATGLFDLGYLVPRLDAIARELPTRFTDQNKDAGKYSQAEQVTWEVIGMLDRPLIFVVRKWDRLLAAKLLLETLMTSGVKLEDPDYPAGDDPAEDLASTAGKLHAGLVRKLEGEYGMRREAGNWVAIPADEIREGLQA